MLKIGAEKRKIPWTVGPKDLLYYFILQLTTPILSKLLEHILLLLVSHFEQ